MRINNFRELEIWKKGIGIVKDIYGMTKKFPKEESYGLISQMRRCAVSIPSNIAEGFNRYHNKEFKQFLYIALGSCAELETQIEVAGQLSYIAAADTTAILDKLNHVSRMITSLSVKLKTSKHT